VIEPEPVVADSACLIALEKIGQLEVLRALFEPVLIPPEVQQEFGVSLPWLKVEIPTNQALVVALNMLVYAGEAEAIALAHEQACRIILDDRKARSVGRNMGLSIVGTIGVLIRGKRIGIIPALKPLMDDLERTGFYVGNVLKGEALRLAEEQL
jgi:uncharacterized protein